MSDELVLKQIYLASWSCWSLLYCRWSRLDCTSSWSIGSVLLNLPHAWWSTYWANKLGLCLLCTNIIINYNTKSLWLSVRLSVTPIMEGQRKRFNLARDIRDCISGHWALETRTRQSPWTAVMALASWIDCTKTGNNVHLHVVACS